MADNLTLGLRVQAADNQIGTIRFLGRTTFSAGEWVGVALDEPTGKNDGTVQGTRYFDCKGDKYGLFVKPTNLKVIEAPTPVRPGGASSAAGRRTSGDSGVGGVGGSGSGSSGAAGAAPKAGARKPSLAGGGSIGASAGRRVSGIYSPAPKSGAAAARLSMVFFFFFNFPSSICRICVMKWGEIKTNNG